MGQYLKRHILNSHYILCSQFLVLISHTGLKGSWSDSSGPLRFCFFDILKIGPFRIYIIWDFLQISKGDFGVILLPNLTYLRKTDRPDHRGSKGEENKSWIFLKKFKPLDIKCTEKLAVLEILGPLAAKVRSGECSKKHERP